MSNWASPPAEPEVSLDYYERGESLFIPRFASGVLAMLHWTIYISFVGVAILALLPRDNARAARVVGLLTTLGGFTEIGRASCRERV